MKLHTVEEEPVICYSNIQCLFYKLIHLGSGQ